MGLYGLQKSSIHPLNRIQSSYKHHPINDQLGVVAMKETTVVAVMEGAVVPTTVQMKPVSMQI